jgi:hypothetical protein
MSIREDEQPPMIDVQEPRREESRPAGSSFNAMAVSELFPDARSRERPSAVDGYHVSVHWVRASDLAARVASRGAAVALRAHLAAHRRVRADVSQRLAGRRDARQRRLAPVSAFGAGSRAEQVAECSPIAR